MAFSLDKAPLFMTLVTIYFLLLPILLYIAIIFARKKEFIKHKNLQISIFIISLIVVFIFELGVRSSGGFVEFSKNSIIPYAFLSKFLIVHVFVAALTLFGWIYLIIKSYFAFKKDKIFFEKKHKVLGVAVFLGLCISSLMGFATYIFLFVI